MIRFLFRFLGLLCLALGFIFLVYDGTKSIADQTCYITKVSDVWAAVHESSLAQLEPMLERCRPGSGIRSRIRAQRAELAVLAIIGTFLILLGRKKKPLIGYARGD